MAVTRINCRGQACPAPVVKTMEVLKNIKEPGIVEVQVDNEIAVENLKKLGARKKLPVTAEKAGPSFYKVTFQIESAEQIGSSPLGSAQAACEPVFAENIQAAGTVIAIGSQYMGSGSDELGAALLKSFIYAVSKLPLLPKTMVFFNGGAHCTCEGSNMASDLKILEKNGVEILTCGTCLDYYGIKDKLLVGKVTDMYSIVEILSNAGKVIKP